MLQQLLGRRLLLDCAKKCRMGFTVECDPDYISSSVNLGHDQACSDLPAGYLAGINTSEGTPISYHSGR